MFIYGQSGQFCLIIKVMTTHSKTEDRRTNRTKQALRDALLVLILEKHYDTITVQNIIDRANVGRSTFYLHFRDKEDLLIEDWSRFLGFFMTHFKWENLSAGRFLPIQELLYHLKDFHHFYRALEKSQKCERLFKTGCNYLAESIEKELVTRFEPKSINIPTSFLSHYLAYEIFRHLRWWLDNNMPNSPEEMDKIFHNLVMPGVRNSFNVAEIKSLVSKPN
jgi:AcrR family transcriptional regulator